VAGALTAKAAEAQRRGAAAAAAAAAEAPARARGARERENMLAADKWGKSKVIGSDLLPGSWRESRTAS